MPYDWVVTYFGSFHTAKTLSAAKAKADKFATDAAHHGRYVKCRVLETNSKSGQTKVVYTGKYNKKYAKWSEQRGNRAAQAFSARARSKGY